jgi:predicted DNA-binding protein
MVFEYSTNTFRICVIYFEPSEVTMSKEVQMSIKMEAELRDQFMAVAVERHRPAAQIIRDLMRLYIADSKTPNALTADTLRRSDKGEDVFYAANSADLFTQLAI